MDQHESHMGSNERLSEGTRSDILWHTIASMTQHYRVAQIVELHDALAGIEPTTPWFVVLKTPPRKSDFSQPSSPSLEFVPDTTATALLVQVAILHQVAKVLLQRISAHTRQFDRIANCDASMLPGKFDDLQ